MSTRSELIRWLDRRGEALLSAPRMWGSLEAVEMQLLLLAEVRTLVLEPEIDREQPRAVIDAYVEHLRQRFPGRASAPLYEIANENEALFVKELRVFLKRLEVALGTLRQPPGGELDLRLEAKPGESLSASAVTGYYEEFRRAIRAIARAMGGGSIPISATDFSLTDVQIERANGTPASARLVLNRESGQIDFDVDARIRRAFADVASLAAWSKGEEALSVIDLPGAERRMVALQSLRLLPTRRVASVEIGGSLLGAGTVDLRSSYSARLVQVVGAGAEVEDFEAEEEVRAIDLDRGTLLLGKARLRVYALHGQLIEVVKVGGRVRVRGQLYKAVFQKKPLVVAKDIEALDDEETVDDESD